MGLRGKPAALTCCRCVCSAFVSLLDGTALAGPAGVVELCVVVAAASGFGALGSGPMLSKVSVRSLFRLRFFSFFSVGAGGSAVVDGVGTTRFVGSAVPPETDLASLSRWVAAGAWVGVWAAGTCLLTLLLCDACTVPTATGGTAPNLLSPLPLPAGTAAFGGSRAGGGGSPAGAFSATAPPETPPLLFFFFALTLSSPVCDALGGTVFAGDGGRGC